MNYCRTKPAHSGAGQAKGRLRRKVWQWQRLGRGQARENYSRTDVETGAWTQAVRGIPSQTEAKLKTGSEGLARGIGILITFVCLGIGPITQIFYRNFLSLILNNAIYDSYIYTHTQGIF